MAEDIERDYRKEVLEEARRSQKLDADRAEYFEVMVKTPGWAQYVAMLAQRIQEQADMLMVPATKVDDIVGIEHTKGVLKGLIIARDLPTIAIEAARREVQDVDPSEA